MTGWCVLYGVGPLALVEAINLVQSRTFSQRSSIAQYAAVEALSGLRGSSEAIRARFRNAVAAISMVGAGSFFGLHSISLNGGPSAPSQRASLSLARCRPRRWAAESNGCRASGTAELRSAPATSAPPQIDRGSTYQRLCGPASSVEERFDDTHRIIRSPPQFVDVFM